MCRCAPGFWPSGQETVHEYLRRSASWPERIMARGRVLAQRIGPLQEAKVPRWVAALLSTWWRWAGLAARLAQWIARALAWRDSSLGWRRNGPSRQRLGRGLPGATSRRWNDPLHAACTAQGRDSTPWQEVAQNRDQWNVLESAFVLRGLQGAVVQQLACSRWMIGDSPPL